MQKHHVQSTVIKHTKLIEFEQFYDNIKKEFIMLMPYYGDSLHEIINKNGPIEKNDNVVKEIAFDLLDKIWILHNCGFVHCDIKPANIVKREFGDNDDNKDIIDGYKLIDFECLKKNKTRSSFSSTFEWTAPEIKPNSKWNKYTYSSDIFSFGLIILYILCKQPLQIDHKKL